MMSKNILNILKTWNLRNDANSKGATLFVLTWDSLENKVWKDEFAKTNLDMMMPYESTLLNNILKDSSFKFLMISILLKKKHSR